MKGRGLPAGDSSGQGNTGTLDGPTWTTSSKIGPYAITGGYVYRSLVTTATNNITMSVWAYWNGTLGDNYLFQNGVGGSDGYGWWISNGGCGSGNKVTLILGGVSCDALSSSYVMPTNQWTHLVLLRDAGTWKLYVNGALTVTGGTSDPATPTSSTSIGNNFNGSLDEVRFYTRVLSAAEVAQLYSYGLPKFAPTAGKLGQGIDSTQSYVNPGNVSSSVNSFSFWMKTASSSPTVNLLDLNAGQSIKIVGGTVTASGLTSPSIFVDGASGSTVNAGWHHIAVTTGTAVNASAVNLGLNATTTAPLDGVLDDVRFYNRVINTDEIKRLYRIGATLKINTDVSRDNPDLERGLVGYWSFDGKDMAGDTAYDRSGNANNGTLTGGPVRAIGKIGQGLSFGASDTDDKVSITSNFNGTGVVSVSAWMYPRGGGGGDFGRIITNEQLYVAVKGSDFSLLFSRDSGANACASLVSVWAANNWYHVVAVSPASGATVQWYINGSDATNEAGCGTPVSATSWNIGNNAGSSRSFNGLIDDVRIYNRALSADEIKRLYNLGR